MTLVGLSEDAIHAQPQITIVTESLKLTVRMVCTVESWVLNFPLVLIFFYTMVMRLSFGPTQKDGTLKSVSEWAII